MWTTSILLLFLLLAHGAKSRVLRLQHHTGHKGQRYWKGELQCPVDFDINVKNCIIENPCSGPHCSHTCGETNLKQIRDKCTYVNLCTVELWDTSLVNGKDVKIEYECRADRLREFFSNAMVKRFYDSENFTPQYCKEHRHRRGIDDDKHIRREPTVGLTFQQMVEARTVLAQHRLMGHFYDAATDLGPVIKTSIRQTRRRRDGMTVKLPIYVSADLTKRTLKPSESRKPIAKELDPYFEICGLRKNTNNDDDRGHLVAYTLGGTDIELNLVPMARYLNRRQGIWYGHEAQVREWLYANPNRMVRWEVIVFYSSVQSNEPFRPIAFALRYTKFEDKQNTASGIERIETFINENEEHRNDQCTLNMGDFFKDDEHDLTLDY